MRLLLLLAACAGEADEPPATGPRPHGGDTADSACPSSSWYRDVDGDGHGDPADPLDACTLPDGYTATADDCSPRDATAYPGAPEHCDGLDHDCDGTTYDADAIEVTPWYTDLDGDGYGVEPAVATACVAPASTVGRTGDCDDTNAAISPRGVEVCDGLDDDCDGLVDGEDDWVSGGASYWPDVDGDGYGDDAAEPVWLCGPTEGYADNDDDCEDGDASLPAELFVDADGDGFGTDPVASVGCAPRSGEARESGDCDDGDASVFPGAPEPDCADPVDHNCDGSAGESDADGDGHVACAECDDADGAVFPGATEVCDGVDQDCDGAIDDDALDGTTWYVDADGDGYGDSAAEHRTCGVPAGSAAVGEDCDDAAASVNPGATESCSTAYDDTCDGDTNDRGASHCTVWYADRDDDGYGGPESACMCAPTDAYALTENSDCDGGDASVHPDAEESGGDGVDQDCDGHDMRLVPLDDAAAVYEGAAANDDLGFSLVAPGDLDGDGAPEVILGARGGSDAYRGALYQAPLSATGVYDVANAPVVVRGEDAGDYVAHRAPALADVDGDGAVDWLVNAWGHDASRRTDAGGVWLLPGPVASGVAAAAATLEITGSRYQVELGVRVAAGSDLDADTVADLVVGSSEPSGGGAVYLFPSTLTGAATEASANLVITGTDAEAAGAGLLASDLDGDGLDDLVLGAPCADVEGGNAGRGYAFAGPIVGSRTTADADSLWEGPTARAMSGGVLAEAGDTDGDGHPEVIVGRDVGPAPWGAWLVRAPFEDQSLADAPWSVTSEVAEGLGLAVLGAVDLNGDGGPDLALGAPGGVACGLPGVYLFLSPGTGHYTDEDASIGLDPDACESSSGSALASPGDLDGDGADELLVGAYTRDVPDTSAGAVFLLYGSALPW